MLLMDLFKNLDKIDQSILSHNENKINHVMKLYTIFNLRNLL